MKKTAVIFLLSIFLFNTVGYFIAFKAVQFEIKTEVQSEIIQGLNINELTSVTINKNNLGTIEWFEDGKEMRYKGEMYDVVKSAECATSITYYCINDKQEESLFANLEEHINTHVAVNKPMQNQKKIIDNVIKVYFSNRQTAKLNYASSSAIQFSPANLTFQSTLIETDSPPPEFV